MDKKSNSFSGQLGFILVAAGSAVGVGNLWRFPYLAAKDGGGLFLVIYFALAFTFGFVLLVSDIAIGRRTQKSAIGAYTQMHPKWRFLGILTFCVPMLITTYYTVIGGWITKYAAAYLTGQSGLLAKEGYFTEFISAPVAPIIFTLLFTGVTAWIVYNGVQGGIERVSRYVMPVLLVLVVAIAGYCLTLRHTDASGQLRTGMEGFIYYLTPHLEGLTLQRFLQIFLDAMSQMFFSLSVSMGVMITYGSYVKKDVNLSRSIRQIEFFDAGVAFLAGAMIVPAVYVFSGTEGMSAGSGLMFVSLPKVFDEMGTAGIIVGAAFFISAIFATLTSCISVMESVVANCMEIFHTERKKTVKVLTVIYLAASSVISLGYSVFYFELPLPNGLTGQLLDVVDYISNSVMMPIIAMLSAILIGWIMKPEYIIEEMEYGGQKFGRKSLYRKMICVIVPAMMFLLLLESTGILHLFSDL